MKNTLENKAKFFAQYYGQNVLMIKNYPYLKIGQETFFNDNVRKDDYLELKPLSQISDEDAKHFIGDFRLTAKDVRKQFSHPNFNFELLLAKDVDYLRSKGYALDWNGITVEEQIEYNWIKLTH